MTKSMEKPRKRQINITKKAIKLLIPLCDKNDGFACASLGNIYDEGLSVKIDKHKGYELFEKSCDLNSVIGCNLLADAITLDHTLPHAEAKYKAQLTKTLEKSCNDTKEYHKDEYTYYYYFSRGFSCSALGEIYESDGKNSKANKLYDKACSLGLSMGCNNLALNYEAKKGLAYDLDKINELFEKEL